MVTDNEARDRVFEVFCNVQASIMDKGYPISSTYLRVATGYTKYRVKKVLKQLKEQELIKSIHCGMYDEMSEQTLLLSGYRLTNKGQETLVYKQAVEREEALIEKIWGNGSTPEQAAAPEDEDK